MTIQRSVKARIRRVLVLASVVGALLLPLLGAQGNSFAGTPTPGSPAVAGPPPGVEIAPGVYEFVNPPTSGGGVHPDWDDICTNEPGWVCFYSPGGPATYTFYQGANPPTEYGASGTPWTEYDNWIGYRVWIHQYAYPNWSEGWGLCIDPNGGPDPIPGWAEDPQDVYVSTNSSDC
jgi:hypothetical protein